MAAIWADVLGVHPVGIRDDFFDLGGHSYQAAVLLTRVQERLGLSLPLGALFAAPTVETLAAVLQRKLEAGTAGSLVPLREEGSRPPVFLIAGIGGHVFTFHKFGRLLGPDQPAYGVKAIGVDGAARTPDRIEDIAARYAEEITAERPDGPIVLGGYSIGGASGVRVGFAVPGGRPAGWAADCVRRRRSGLPATAAAAATIARSLDHVDHRPGARSRAGEPRGLHCASGWRR